MTNKNDGIDAQKVMELIESAIEAHSIEQYYALPCRVEKYDDVANSVEVELLIKFRPRYKTEEKPFPILVEVPVGFMNSMGGQCYMSFPIEKDDIGTVYFSTLDMDNYLSSNGKTPVDCGSYTRHQLKDAMFSPIIRPFNVALAGVSKTDVLVKNKKSLFSVLPTGKYKLAGETFEALTEISASMKAVSDALTAIKNTLTSISGATVAVAGLQVPLTQAAAIVALINLITPNITALDTAKTHFDELKS